MCISFIEPLLTIVGLVSLGVFVLAFKLAASEACNSARARTYEPELPRAALSNVTGTTGRRWLRGAGKQQIIRHIPFVQAGLVAFGITSIFIMLLCMTGVLLTLLLVR